MASTSGPPSVITVTYCTAWGFAGRHRKLRWRLFRELPQIRVVGQRSPYNNGQFDVKYNRELVYRRDGGYIDVDAATSACVAAHHRELYDAAAGPQPPGGGDRSLQQTGPAPGGGSPVGGKSRPY